MYVLLIPLVTIAIVIFLWSFIPWYAERSVDKKEPRRPEIRKVPTYKYGLQFNPVQSLQESLPEAPVNTLWEIKVIHEDGEYGLSLGLYNLLTEQIQADIIYSLSFFEDGGRRTSMADLYRIRKDQLVNVTSVNQEIIKSIIHPMTQWAYTQLPKELTVKQTDDLDYVLFAGKSENSVALEKKIV